LRFEFHTLANLDLLDVAFIHLSPNSLLVNLQDLRYLLEMKISRGFSSLAAVLLDLENDFTRDTG
jgi:hypothetical protein